MRHSARARRRPDPLVLETLPLAAENGMEVVEAFETPLSPSPAFGGTQSGVAFTQVDLGTPSPPNYLLEVIVDQSIPPGASVTCPFTLTTDVPLPAGSTIRFDAYNGSYVYGADPNLANNRVIFGIGPALPPSVVSGPDGRWLALLAIAIAAMGLVRRAQAD